MQLGSGVAVAVAEASRCTSNLTPSLGTSICHGCSPKKQKKKKKKKKKDLPRMSKTRGVEEKYFYWKNESQLPTNKAITISL